jgi:hypothetical protein
MAFSFIKYPQQEPLCTGDLLDCPEAAAAAAELGLQIVTCPERESFSVEPPLWGAPNSALKSPAKRVLNFTSYAAKSGNTELQVWHPVIVSAVSPLTMHEPSNPLCTNMLQQTTCITNGFFLGCVPQFQSAARSALGIGNASFLRVQSSQQYVMLICRD